MIGSLPVTDGLINSSASSQSGRGAHSWVANPSHGVSAAVGAMHLLSDFDTVRRSVAIR